MPYGLGDGTVDTHTETVGISEAAKHLGISVEAVRQRIRRKKLEAYKGPDGVWRIVLPDPIGSTEPVVEAVPDGVQVNVQLPVGGAATHAYEELIAQLRGEVAFLREEMDKQRAEWSEQARRKDIIIHELTTQLKALPAAVVEVQEEHMKQAAETPVPAPSRPWWKFWEWGSPTP